LLPLDFLFWMVGSAHLVRKYQRWQSIGRRAKTSHAAPCGLVMRLPPSHDNHPLS
jgi:hypothetical protein